MSEKRNFEKEYQHLVTEWLAEDEEDQKTILHNFATSLQTFYSIHSHKHDLNIIKKWMRSMYKFSVKQIEDYYKKNVKKGAHD